MQLTRPQTFSYRPDIDGLRAVAVLLVLAFHFFPEIWAGGFLGVDIFFVISGFLITSIIWGQLGREEFSFTEFYLRRIRRLFPALLAVLSLTTLAAYWLFVPSEWAELGRTLEAAATFVPNLYFWRHTGYFDVDINKQPLMHLWSLGVEEQFYLVWPCLLLALKRFRISPMLMVSALGVASLAFAASRFEGMHDRAFYLPQFHAWELAVGCALGLWSRIPSRAEGEISALMGALLIVEAVALSKVYGAILLEVMMAVTGAGLLIAGGPTAVFSRILGCAPLAALGRRSYALYLWHWPLFCFALTVSSHRSVSLSERWQLLALSFLLAEVTYTCIERPLRRHRLSFSLPLVAAIAVILLVGFRAGSGKLQPRSASFSILSQFDQRAFGNAHCAKSRSAGSVTVCELTLEKSEVLFWGDSNSIQYAPRVEKLMQDGSRPARAVSFINAPKCPPIPGADPSHYPGCEAGENFVTEMAAHPEVKTVVLAAQWIIYFGGANDTGPVLAGSNPEERKMLASLEAAIRGWRSAGKEVVVVLSTPYWPPEPQLIIGRSLWKPWTVAGAVYSRAKWDRKHLDIVNEIRRHAEMAGARVIDPTPYLCDDKDCPAVTPDGQLIYADADHLTDSYVRDHVTYLDELIVRTNARGSRPSRNAGR